MNVVFKYSIRLYKDGHQKSFSRITITQYHPQFFVSAKNTIFVVGNDDALPLTFRRRRRPLDTFVFSESYVSYPNKPIHKA